MTDARDWTRVSHRTPPCPKCGKRDWCMVRRDPETGQVCACICGRVEEGHARVTRNGYLHEIGPGDSAPVSWPESRPAPRMASHEAVRLAALALTGMNPRVRSQWASSLGVSVESLAMLDAGVIGNALAFPMRDANRKIVGIRTRTRAGKKLSVKGSRQGLFLPAFHGSRRVVFFCEGPTDTAALLTLGLWAVGRPSCFGCEDWCCAVAEKWAHRAIVVMDNDAPGAAGGRRLLEAVGSVCEAAMLCPPQGIKDARDWLGAGLSREELIGSAKAAMETHA
jgi:hypothetical protein